MAGGRRPASYVSGARHNTGVDRSATTYENPASPPVGSTAGPSLPPWIPSIWQPSASKPAPVDLTVLPVPARVASPVHADPSSALAAALDSAVQSAVVRALGAPASVVDQGSEESESAAWAAKESELMGVVESLQQRLDKRDEDVRNLSERLLAMERKMAVEAETVKRREERLRAEMSVHVKKLSESLERSERRFDARMSTVHDQVKSNQSGIAKLRTAQRSSENDARRMKKWGEEISDEMRQLELSLCSELEKSWSHVEQMGQSLSVELSKVSEAQKKEQAPSAAGKEIEDLKRSLEATVETVATARSKLKRVESQVADVSKQVNDMTALNSGFEETIRESLVKVTSVIDGLGTSVAQMQKDLPNQPGKLDDMGSVESRLDSVESNLKALKKLIESNLRTQWNAESIVKEQVSLITKHVCVAMRQYTARRISENNALIDQALRARVPEYAKNEDQFVLVREQDPDGNESIDIQRSSEVSSNASS